MSSLVNTDMYSLCTFQEIADPFYAYCKQHGDKAIVRAKRRNYLAIQSHYRSHKDQEVLDEKEKVWPIFPFILFYCHV